MNAHLRAPNFDRLTSTLLGGKADAVPLIELGIHPTIKQAVLGRPVVSVRDDAEFMRSMGYDFVKIQPGISFPLHGPSGPPRQRPGDMNALSFAWAPEGHGVIATWEDFERYPWPVAADISYARFEEARSGLPEGMGIIGQYGDIFTVAWELMGFESFAVAMFEQPDLVGAIYQRVAELILSMFETMASMDHVGALWFSDDIAYSTGLMVGPEFLREHFFPCLARIGALAAARHLPFIYHTDGLLWDVMPDIVASGVTALHPIEPKAMDIVEVKRRYGNRLCLCGGIEVDLLARATPEEIRALTMRYLRDVAPGGGWCAGSSNSIPEYVPLENFASMVETVLMHGGYE